MAQGHKRSGKKRHSDIYPKAYIDEPARHPDNKELRLYYDSVFEDRYVVQMLNGPLVYEYTHALIDQINEFYSAWPKVFAVRVDLYFPVDWTLEQRLNKAPVNEDGLFSKDYFTRFIESLNSKLAVYYRATDRLEQARRLPLAYCCAFEVGHKKKNRGLHIHALLMTNGHAFYSLGNYSSKEALAKRSFSTLVREAWASALFGFDRNRSEYPANDWRSTIPNFKHIERVFDDGLVNFSRAWGERHRRYEDPFEFHYSQMIDVIFAASYLCKAHTKYFKDGLHPFRCSRSKSGVKGAQGSAQTLNLKYSTPLKSINYHRGNKSLALVVPKGDAQGTTLDSQAGNYIEPDLNAAWDYLDKKLAVSSDFVAVRFGLEVDWEALGKRKRFKYVERLYGHIESAIRRMVGHVGKARSTDISHLKALNSWQQEGGQLLLHIVLLIEGSVFDQLHLDRNKENYLHSFLADLVSYAYSLGEEQARDRLTIYSLHRLTQGLGNSEDELRTLRRHIGYLCLSEPSVSQASTLYCR
jgi:hypothetical protein